MENLTLKNFHEGLRAKKWSAEEVLKDHLETIRTKDGDIHAFLRTLDDSALAEARRVDALVASGQDISALAGAPIALKDNILLEGELATAASKILENYRASYDAGVVRKLKEQNAVFIGKTNLDEFAMGSSTEYSAYQSTRNPLDLGRVPGGSSGGSAAAVAADMALASLGSDTGGSIRQPASYCGIVGLKPTYGSVSRSGLIALASSLDQIGPFAKTVSDARLVFDAIQGADPMDATSHREDTASHIVPENELRKLVIGVPKEYFGEGLNSGVARAIDHARKTFEKLGLVFKEISLPHTSHAVSAYYIILPAEASANLARFDGIRYERNTPASRLKEVYLKNRGRGFGNEVKRRIILGTFVLSSGYYDAYYAKAQQVRSLIDQDFARAFEDVDLIFTPVTPSTAFKIGEKKDDPLAMYLNDIFTIPTNLAGLPAISIPCREKVDNLPAGFQLIGKHFHEGDILSLGELYEKHS